MRSFLCNVLGLWLIGLQVAICGAGKFQCVLEGGEKISNYTIFHLIDHGFQSLSDCEKWKSLTVTDLKMLHNFVDSDEITVENFARLVYLVDFLNGTGSLIDKISQKIFEFIRSKELKYLKGLGNISFFQNAMRKVSVETGIGECLTSRDRKFELHPRNFQQQKSRSNSLRFILQLSCIAIPWNSLDTVSIESITFDDESALEFGIFLEHQSKLKEFSVVDCYFPVPLHEIINFCKFSYLKSLIIQDCNVKQSTLLSVLQQIPSRLEQLDISRNQIKFLHFPLSLKFKLDQLQILDISRNSFYEAQFDEFLKAINFKFLKTLKIASTSSSALILSKILVGATKAIKLEFLDFSGNCCTEENFEQLTNSLSCWPRLKFLNLSMCQILPDCWTLFQSINKLPLEMFAINLKMRHVSNMASSKMTHFVLDLEGEPLSFESKCYFPSGLVSLKLENFSFAGSLLELVKKLSNELPLLEELKMSKFCAQKKNNCEATVLPGMRSFHMENFQTKSCTDVISILNCFSNLDSLSLVNLRAADNSEELVGTVLAKMGKLTSLEISNCLIFTNLLLKIKSGIFCSLKKLKILETVLDFQTTKLFFQVLPATIEELSFSVFIDDQPNEKIVQLINFFPSNSHLKVLNLNFAISKLLETKTFDLFLKKMPMLHTLKISHFPKRPYLDVFLKSIHALDHLRMIEYECMDLPIEDLIFFSSNYPPNIRFEGRNDPQSCCFFDFGGLNEVLFLIESFSQFCNYSERIAKCFSLDKESFIYVLMKRSARFAIAFHERDEMIWQYILPISPNDLVDLTLNSSENDKYSDSTTNVPKNVEQMKINLQVFDIISELFYDEVLAWMLIDPGEDVTLFVKNFYSLLSWYLQEPAITPSFLVVWVGNGNFEFFKLCYEVAAGYPFGCDFEMNSNVSVFPFKTFPEARDPLDLKWALQRDLFGIYNELIIEESNLELIKDLALMQDMNLLEAGEFFHGIMRFFLAVYGSQNPLEARVNFSQLLTIYNLIFGSKSSLLHQKFISSSFTALEKEVLQILFSNSKINLDFTINLNGSDTKKLLDLSAFCLTRRSPLENSVFANFMQMRPFERSFATLAVYTEKLERFFVQNAISIHECMICFQYCSQRLLYYPLTGKGNLHLHGFHIRCFKNHIKKMPNCLSPVTCPLCQVPLLNEGRFN